MDEEDNNPNNFLKDLSLYEEVLKSCPDHMIILDLTAHILYINHTVPEMDKEEVIGKSVYDFTPPEFHKATEECFKYVLETSRSGSYKTTYQTKDNELQFFDVNVGPIIKEDKIIALLSRSIDITDQEKTNEALRKEVDFSKSLIDTAQAIVLVLDVEGKIVDFNPYMERISGYKLEEVKGRDWFTTFLTEDDYERIRNIFKKAIGDIQTRGNVNPIIAKDGSLKDIEWYDKTLKDKKNNIVGILSIGHDITERKKAEENLKESEERLNSFLESATDGFILFDAQLNYISINKAALKIIGLDLKDVVGKNILDVVPKIKETDRYNKYREVIETGIPFIISDLVPHPKFGIKHLELKAFKISEGLGMIFTDITERKKAEENLFKNECLLKEAQKVASIGHWELDPEVGTPVWSDEIFHIFGLDPKNSEPSFVDHETHITPEDWPILNEAVTKASTDGTPFNIRFRIVRPSNEIRWMQAIGTTSIDENGKVIKLFGTAQDITELKKAENESATARRNLQDTINVLPDIFFSLDLEGKLAMWNKTFENVTGYTEEQVSEMNATDFFMGEEVQQAADAIAATMKEGVFSIELNLVTKDKRKIPYFFTASRLEDEKGQPAGITGTGHDITESKKAEEELKKAAAYIEAMGDALVVLNMQRKITKLNQTAMSLLGYSEKELSGLSLEDIFPKKEHEKHYAQMKITIEKGTTSMFETFITTKDAKEIPVLLSGTAMKDPEGNPVEFIGVLRDITDRRKTEEEIKRNLNDLQEFKDLTIHRENRIIELKREINELCKELGRAAPYDLSFISQDKE